MECFFGIAVRTFKSVDDVRKKIAPHLFTSTNIRLVNENDLAITEDFCIRDKDFVTFGQCDLNIAKYILYCGWKSLQLYNNDDVFFVVNRTNTIVHNDEKHNFIDKFLKVHDDWFDSKKTEIQHICDEFAEENLDSDVSKFRKELYEDYDQINWLRRFSIPYRDIEIDDIIQKIE